MTDLTLSQFKSVSKKELDQLLQQEAVEMRGGFVGDAPVRPNRSFRYDCCASCPHPFALTHHCRESFLLASLKPFLEEVSTTSFADGTDFLQLYAAVLKVHPGFFQDEPLDLDLVRHLEFLELENGLRVKLRDFHKGVRGGLFCLQAELTRQELDQAASDREQPRRRLRLPCPQCTHRPRSRRRPYPSY